MEYVGLYVRNGQVVTDTHGFFAEEVINNTDLARKLHPNAKVVGDKLFIGHNDYIRENDYYDFTIPTDGVYEIIDSGNVIKVCFQKGRVLNFWISSYESFSLTKVL